MLIMGIDENGMGPRLGPLVATGVVLEVSQYRAAPLRRRGAALGLGDSKDTSGFGRMTRAEDLALAVMEHLNARSASEHAPSTLDMDEVSRRLLLSRGFAAPCPDASTARQCFDRPLTVPAFEGDIARGRTLLAKLQGRALKLRWARSAVACVGRLNREHDEGRNKVVTDLTMFEELMLAARHDLGEDLVVICGMVGGIRKYPTYFRRLRDVHPLDGDPGKSHPAKSHPAKSNPGKSNRGKISYAARGFSHISFEIKADNKHLPVGLASMIGKYVRELFVERQLRFYRHHQPDLPRASGYHDPVTRRFIEQSAPLRRKLSIAPNCFERR